ncbi:hypothetical protein D3C77_561540 [compost metagenome]
MLPVAKSQQTNLADRHGDEEFALGLANTSRGGRLAMAGRLCGGGHVGEGKHSLSSSPSEEDISRSSPPNELNSGLIRAQTSQHCALKSERLSLALLER